MQTIRCGAGQPGFTYAACLIFSISRFTCLRECSLRVRDDRAGPPRQAGGSSSHLPPRCRYDLIGLPEGSTACSECGRDLTRRRARRIGNRHPRRGLIWAGILLLAPSLAWFGVFGWIVAHRVDVNHYKPYFVLAREAIAENQQLRENAIVELTRTAASRQVERGAGGSLLRRPLRGLRCHFPWDYPVGHFSANGAGGEAACRTTSGTAIGRSCSPGSFGVREEVRLDDPIPILVTTPRLSARARQHLTTRIYLAELRQPCHGQTCANGPSRLQIR